MIWIIMLHFTVYGMDISVLPPNGEVGYAKKISCNRAIPKVRTAFAESGYPQPKSIRCHQIELR